MIGFELSNTHAPEPSAVGQPHLNAIQHQSALAGQTFDRLRRPETHQNLIHPDKDHGTPPGHPAAPPNPTLHLESGVR
jgi:hypothetical protein